MSSQTESSQDLGWMPHLILLLVTFAALGTAIGMMFVLVSIPERSTTEIPPTFRQWRTADALHAFQEAGLSVELVRLPRDERDAFSNLVVMESRQFRIPNQGAQANGIILSFENQRDMRRMQDYYTALGEALPQYSSWVFVKGNLLLQINGSVPELVARRYAEALNLLEAW